MMRLRGLARDDSGSELVELAMTVAILMTLLLGLVDSSRALYAGHLAANLAAQAARYAIVRGSTAGSAACDGPLAQNCVATGASVRAFVLSQTPLAADARALSVTTTWPGVTGAGGSCSSSRSVQGPGCVVRVELAYAFSFFGPAAAARRLYAAQRFGPHDPALTRRRFPPTEENPHPKSFGDIQSSVQLSQEFNAR